MNYFKSDLGNATFRKRFLKKFNSLLSAGIKHLGEQQTAPAKPYSETLFPLMPQSATTLASRSTA